MREINFKSFSIPVDITGKSWQTVDIREAFANSIYMKYVGIRAYALAMKIFKSDGNIEYDDEEVNLMREAIEKYGMPPLIDGFNKCMNEQEKEIKKT